MNGYVHHVDRVLMLPKSTSDLLGDDPEFSILREGLIQTNVAVTINDTSTHVGQTVFAPSNAAFDQLGSKTKRFLFSPGGRRYLKALLEYHVVANRTMFTDVYFQERGRGQISLQEGSMVSPSVGRGCGDSPDLLTVSNYLYSSISLRWCRDTILASPSTRAMEPVSPP